MDDGDAGMMPVGWVRDQAVPRAAFENPPSFRTGHVRRPQTFLLLWPEIRLPRDFAGDVGGTATVRR
jgi:hypothetical protein